MIHVRVREQQHIHRRQFTHGQRRRHVTFRAHRAHAQGKADAVAESGVRENANPVKINEHRRVPNPAEGDRVIGPFMRTRLDRRGLDRAAGILSK